MVEKTIGINLDLLDGYISVWMLIIVYICVFIGGCYNRGQRECIKLGQSSGPRLPLIGDV